MSIHTDKATMLESYIRDIHARGPQRYTSDHRPIVQFESDTQPISADNPQGLGNRIDTPEGVQAYLAKIAPMKGVTQGLICWGLAYARTRAMSSLKYLPDAGTNWPDSIKANLPTLVNGLKAGGDKLGLLFRPCQVMDDLTSFRQADPASAKDLAWTKLQFDTAMAWGCSMGYLDSCGNTLADYQTLKAVRDSLPASFLTISEFYSDLTLRDHGVYFEQHSSGAPEIDVETIRLLYPNAVIACLPRCELPATWFLKYRVTPIVSDWQSGIMVPLLAAVTAGMKGMGWK